MSNTDSAGNAIKKNFLSKTYSLTVKQLLIIAGIFILILAVVVIMNSIQANKKKKQFALETQQLRAEARQRFLDNTKLHLKLLAKPYVWAVRKELQQNNLQQINSYANDIVKEKYFVSAMVINPKNIIVSSTDKKYEGKDYSLVGNASLLAGDSTQVVMLNDSLAQVTSPVMNFNSKLGTVILKYSIRMNPL